MKTGSPRPQALLGDCLRSAFPVPEDGEFEVLLARFGAPPERSAGLRAPMLRLFGARASRRAG